MEHGPIRVKVGHAVCDAGRETLLHCLDGHHLGGRVVEQIAQGAAVGALDEQTERVGGRVVHRTVKGDDVCVRQPAERTEVALGAPQQLGAFDLRQPIEPQLLEREQLAAVLDGIDVGIRAAADARALRQLRQFDLEGAEREGDGLLSGSLQPHCNIGSAEGGLEHGRIGRGSDRIDGHCREMVWRRHEPRAIDVQLREQGKQLGMERRLGAERARGALDDVRAHARLARHLDCKLEPRGVKLLQRPSGGFSHSAGGVVASELRQSQRVRLLLPVRAAASQLHQ